jgi:hypothetical protein
MCLLYAIILRLWYGGKLYLHIAHKTRDLHFSVKSKGRMIHGTNKDGKWHVECRPWHQYEEWAIKGSHLLIKIA